MTAVTAVTAQNTHGVFGIHPIPPEFIQKQMRLVLSDIGADCIKLGMLGDAEIIDAVADVLDREAAGIPVVADPVMVAKGGARLLDPKALDTYKRRIPFRAALLTPNAPEAEVLAGHPIHDRQDAHRVAAVLPTLGAEAVLLKGGHVPGPDVEDLLASADGVVSIRGPRIETRHTHGTGCTLASGIACGLAQGLALEPAVRRAIAYVQEAIRTAPGLGGGHGPLNHAHTVGAFPPPGAA